MVDPAHKRKYGEETIATAGLDPAFVFDAEQLRQPKTLEVAKDLCPDIGVSALFGYILRREILDLMPQGSVNIHPAFFAL